MGVFGYVLQIDTLDIFDLDDLALAVLDIFPFVRD